MLNILSNAMSIATRTVHTDSTVTRPRNYVYSIAEKRQREEAVRNMEIAKTRRYFG